jgi:hypothetical protein
VTCVFLCCSVAVNRVRAAQLVSRQILGSPRGEGILLVSLIREEEQMAEIG